MVYSQYIARMSRMLNEMAAWRAKQLADAAATSKAASQASSARRKAHGARTQLHSILDNIMDNRLEDAVVNLERDAPNGTMKVGYSTFPLKLFGSGNCGSVGLLNVNSQTKCKYLTKVPHLLIKPNVLESEARNSVAAAILNIVVPNFPNCYDVFNQSTQYNDPRMVVVMSKVESSYEAYVQSILQQDDHTMLVAAVSAVCQYIISKYSFVAILGHSLRDRHTGNIMVDFTHNPYIDYSDAGLFPKDSLSFLPALPGPRGAFGRLVHIDFGQVGSIVSKKYDHVYDNLIKIADGRGQLYNHCDAPDVESTAYMYDVHDCIPVVSGDRHLLSDFPPRLTKKISEILDSSRASWRTAVPIRNSQKVSVTKPSHAVFVVDVVRRLCALIQEQNSVLIVGRGRPMNAQASRSRMQQPSFGSPRFQVMLN